MKGSILLPLASVPLARAFLPATPRGLASPPPLCQDANRHQRVEGSSLARRPRGPLQARERSKWDDLVDDDDEEDDENEAGIVGGDIPADMTYNEANIRRQAETYDRLESIGGSDVVNDVYVRAPGAREWWLVGKVARISDVSPERAIERQWPLIERHVWALRLPVRPSADLAAPFEVWYAPGDSELDAARNDPHVQFTKVSNAISYDGGDVPASFVGFVGKAYDERRGEPLFFVERNAVDGSCLTEREVKGDWMLRSELPQDEI